VDLLSNPICSLETLNFASKNFDDEPATTLGDALAVNNTLRSLILDYHENMTINGREGIAKGLQSSLNLQLEEFSAIESEMKDEGAIALILVLAEIPSFKKLHMSSNLPMTSKGWLRCMQLLLNSQAHSRSFICTTIILQIEEQHCW